MINSKIYTHKATFKNTHSLEERKEEARRVIAKYKFRKPIICERGINTIVPSINKKKYLVPNELTAGQFIYVIRRRIKLEPSKALFIFINGIIPCSSTLIIELYEKYKDQDGFLYITYNGENVFGKKYNYNI